MAVNFIKALATRVPAQESNLLGSVTNHDFTGCPRTNGSQIASGKNPRKEIIIEIGYQKTLPIGKAF